MSRHLKIEKYVTQAKLKLDFQNEYLEIVSSVHVQLYNFRQHRLIWFGLGARYNITGTQEAAMDW